MTMKLNHYAMALMLGMGLAGAGSTAQAADAISTFADIGGYSQYVWRGAAQGTGQSSLQGDVGVEHESGLSANVWFATGVGDSEKEYDITVDFSGESSVIGYSLGYIAYKFVDDTALNATEFYAGLSYQIASATLYNGDGYNYLEFGVGDTVADMFDASATVGYTMPDVGDSEVNHVTLGASTDFDMGAYTLSPSISYAMPQGVAGDVLDNEFVVGINASF